MILSTYCGGRAHIEIRNNRGDAVVRLVAGTPGLMQPPNVYLSRAQLDELAQAIDRARDWLDDAPLIGAAQRGDEPPPSPTGDWQDSESTT